MSAHRLSALTKINKLAKSATTFFMKGAMSLRSFMTPFSVKYYYGSFSCLICPHDTGNIANYAKFLELNIRRKVTEGKWKELLQKINECSGFVTIIFFTEYRVYICVRKNVSSFKKASFCCSFFCGCLMCKFLSLFLFC